MLPKAPIYVGYRPVSMMQILQETKIGKKAVTTARAVDPP